MGKGKASKGPNVHRGKECAVPMCSSISSRTKGITYFSFPTSEPLRKIWAKMVSRREQNGELWMPTPNSRVCNLHFLESDFRYWGDYRRLIPNAVPTAFPGYPPKILRRQAKMLANFRKDHPLGVETTEKSSAPAKETEEKSQKSKEDSQLAPELEDHSYGSHQSSSMANNNFEEQRTVENTDVGSKEDDTVERRLSTEDSEVPRDQSEGPNPFKKRRIETDEQSSGDGESEQGLSTEGSKLSRNQSSMSNEFQESNPEENSLSREDNTLGRRLKTPSVGIANDSVESNTVTKTSQLVQSQEDDTTVRRGMRLRKRLVKFEFDSEELKSVAEAQEDDNYVPDQSSKKRKSLPGAVLLQRLKVENNDSEESQFIRKIKRLEQQVKWKDERLFSLNQKAVSERNARLKAENELESLRQSNRNDSLVITRIPKGSKESSTRNEELDEDFPVVSIQEDLKLNQIASISNKKAEQQMKNDWAKTIQNLKQELIVKDQRLMELNKKPILGGNEHVEVQQSKSKNRYTQTVKQILEDSKKGDAKALFLLDQLEAYGKGEVTKFRMSTIKACVELRLLNARGYDSMRNMNILTLPNKKVIREHVDVLADTGVTAVEEVSLDDDIAELVEEILKEDSQSDSTYGFYSNEKDFEEKKKMILRIKQCKGVAEDDTLTVGSADLLQIIEEARQQLKTEPPSSSSIEDDHSTDKKWFGKKGKPMAKGDQRRVAEPVDMLKKDAAHQTVRKPFKMKLPSGILIEEVQSTNENHSDAKASPENVDETMGHGSYDKTIDENLDKGDGNFKVACSTVMTSQKNVDDKMEQDPTSETLIHHTDSEDLEDIMGIASEDFMPDANLAEVATEFIEEEVIEDETIEDEAMEDEVMEPTSEHIVEPASEDMIEPASEDMIEPASECLMPDRDYAEVKDKFVEEHLAPGGYLEEVCSSHDDTDGDSP